ncbi:HAD family hydrolase [Geobacillus sp. TFV-3]|uniref:HAD family hydrolase n=1 Tax=Geobacillus sp. TFV-3 TaxID=1897059 RepID=UPI001F2CC2B3|nr:HAD family hydrolase [Geobacillus sp. TFV-3]
MHGADIKVIVFDLDGTLYEETSHFDYYAEQVAKRLCETDRPRFWNDYRAVLAGRHPLRIGVMYDTKEGWSTPIAWRNKGMQISSSLRRRRVCRFCAACCRRCIFYFVYSENY